MRVVALAREAVVTAAVPTLGDGPVAAAAAAFLARETRAGRLTARSLELYLGVLREIGKAAGTRSLARALAPDALAAFLAAPALPRWRARLTVAVLRRFVVDATGSDAPVAAAIRALGWVDHPADDPTDDPADDVDTDESALKEEDAVRDPAGDPLGGPPDDPAGRPPAPLALVESLTRARLEAVAREAERVLHEVQGRWFGHPRTATAHDLLRASLVAMCRYAGATPADLMAATFDDLAPDGVWRGVVGPEWRTVRVKRQERGAAKEAVVTLELPEVARRWLERWIAHGRKGRGVPPGIRGRDPVWLVPDVGRPLGRREVWRRVAGIGTPTAGTAVAQEPVGQRALAADGRTDAVDPRIEINPTLLRHVLGFELARAADTRAAFVAAAERRLGLQERARYARYRALLDGRAATPAVDLPAPAVA